MMGVSSVVVGGWSKVLRFKVGQARELWRRRVLRKRRRAESRADGHQIQSREPSGTGSREFRCSDAACSTHTQHAAGG